MARYSSLITLQGTIGEWVFYSKNGKNFVRAKAQVPKAVLTDGENYATFRANGAEFGNCARMGKLLRLALTPVLEFLDDATAYYRLSSLLTKVKNCDLVSEIGKRSIAVGLQSEAGTALLTGFRFNAKRDFYSLVYSYPFFQRVGGKVLFSSFDASLFVKFVPGTNCLYLQVLLVAADFESGVFSVVAAAPYHIMAGATSVLLDPISLEGAGDGVHLLVVAYGLGVVTNGTFYRMRIGEWGVDVLGVI
jgi:hypothetical protein